MTVPITSDPQDFSEAVDRLSQVASGNIHINTHPGLMTALAGSNATPAQAQMIDQYMAGVKAQNMYQLAKASGGKPITFTVDEKAAMGAMGFDYSALDAEAQQALPAVPAGQGAAGAGSSSSPASAPLASPAQPQKKNGFFDQGIKHGLGRIGYDVLHNPVVNNPVTNNSVTRTMGEGLNVVQAAGAGVLSDVQSVEQHLGIEQSGNLLSSIPGGFLIPEKGVKYGGALDAQRKEQMTALGYDPNSIISNLAFDAHGYAKSDTTSALQKWDDANGEQKWGWSAQEAQSRALQFAKDPESVWKSIVADTSLTPAETDRRLAALSSPEFTALSQRLQADDATFGHATALAAGIDPVEHPLAFNLAAAATDTVASFYIDPTMNVGRVVNAVRKLPLAIEGMSDTERMASLLDPAQAGLSPARNRLINNMSSFVDSINVMRDAMHAGDAATYASEYARVTTKTPEWQGLIPDFIGKSQSTAWTTADEAAGTVGVKSDVYKLVEGRPITNLAEATEFITQKGGNLRLMAGKAPVESSYMPGAVSNWGFRAFKANRAAHGAYQSVAQSAADSAEWLAAREAGKLGEEDANVVKAAWRKADPGEATHSTIDIKNIRRLLPTSEDGIAIESGAIVASPDAALIGRHVGDALAAEKAAVAAGTTAQRAAKDAELAGALGTDSERALTASQSVTAQAAHAAALKALSAKTDELASALRAAREDSGSASTWGEQLTNAERGKIAFNKRAYGSVVAPEDAATKVGGWSSPTAIAARGRLAIARWSNQLPINTEFELNSQRTAQKVGQFARFYLGKGEANRLAAQFAGGDIGTRKAIVQGLWEQVAHAAGLSRTDAGRALLDSTTPQSEVYTHVGSGWAVDGQQVALHKGQQTDVIKLPSFKQIHDAAAKAGLYEATVGRVATSTAADRLFNPFRTGLLLRPATGLRNATEPYLLAIMKGAFGQALRGRAVTYSSADELAALGEKLGIKDLGLGEVPPQLVDLARRNLSEKIAAGASPHQIAVAQHTIERVEKGDFAALSGFGRTRLGSTLSDYLSHMTRFYRSQLLQQIPEAELKYIPELYEQLPQMLHHYADQTIGSALDPLGAMAIRDSAETGLASGRADVNLAGGSHPLLSVAKSEGGGKFRRDGFALESTDRSVGTQRYINALHQRTYGSPETAKAAVAAARAEPGEGDLTAVIDALDKENATGGIYGHYYKPNPDSADAARAITPSEVALGKRQWAQDLVNDYRYMLKGQDGELNTKIADHIAVTGKAPDELWFDENLKKGELPALVLAPHYEPVAGGGAEGLAQNLQEISGKIFNRLVEGTIKRQASSPVLAAHYLKARVENESMLQHVMSGGLSEATAQEVLKGQAIRSAYVRSAQMLDDPGQKTQFDIVARNLVMFPRAMQAFIRRWGGTLAADPFKARKMMLALEGTEHSGLIYRDEYGQETFTYPGSQVMRDAMVALSHVPGFSNIAKFPLGMDMTGKVMQASAGSFQNPLRFSLSPMVNIPMREIFSLMPEHQSMWTEVDTALNGGVGVSQAKQGALASLEPSALKNLVAATSSDEKNAIFASAFTGAYAHLHAAGLTPGPNATLSEVDTFMNQLKVQVRNQLYLRFAFGLVAPASPSALQENIAGSDSSKAGAFSGTAADYAFSVSGIKNLSSEYKSILDAAGGDVARATSIFTGLHPEGIAYTVSSTGSTVNKAYMPATKASLGWMEKNIDFLNKYKSVGAYFMPKEPGDFDMSAYNAQMALGVRQKKTLKEFSDSVQVAAAGQEYYQKLDWYNQAHDAAVVSGDKAGASTMSAGFSNWSQDYLDKHPILKAKFAASTVNTDAAERQIGDLTKMVADGEAPSDLAPKLDEMLKIFKAAGDWKSAQPNTAEANAQKQAVAAGVDERLGSIAASDPRLTNIYNAVFRTVDRKLTKVG